MKFKIHLMLGLLVLSAGCASTPDNITFSDEAEIRAVAGTAPAASPKRLEKADELKIEQQVFGYLLERHFWDLADYSAVFIQADDAQIKALIAKYPDHVPPVKPSSHAEVQPHLTPMDKDTKKPAMILSAEINEPNADGSVDAIGRWYAGDAVTGFRAVHLTKLNGDWQIAEVK
jgi:hypothetical protein